MSQLHNAPDPADSESVKLLAVTAVLTGCVPTLSAGYDASSSVKGPIRGLLNQPVATARGENAPPVENTRSYAFAAGLRSRVLGIEAGVQLYDVKGASFSVPTEYDPTSPRFLITTASLDVRARVLKTKYFATDMHIGPAGGFLVDRGAGATQVGQGFRVGIGFAATLGPLNTFADLYVIDMAFRGDGPAAGTSSMTGLTLGVALR